MIALLSAVGVAVVGSLGAYLAAARKMSGKITTTEASTLWAEADKLRGEYRNQAAAMREQLDRCNQRIAELEATVREQAATIERLERELATYRDTDA